MIINKYWKMAIFIKSEFSFYENIKDNRNS